MCIIHHIYLVFFYLKKNIKKILAQSHCILLRVGIVIGRNKKLKYIRVHFCNYITNIKYFIV